MMSVGSPSVLSTVSCVGSTSNAGLNVRVSEVVSCTIQSVAISGAPAIATPSDFLPPLAVGGTPSAISATGNASVLVFTIVSPSTIAAAFSVTGRLASGAAFSQGALAMSVGTLGWRKLLA